MNIEIKVAEYLNEKQANDIGELLNAYSEDPMGGGVPLPNHIKENLAKELAKLPHAFSIICYVDGQPAGLINCFEAFSTFKCKPLINIHDIIVIKSFRGLGICQKMLALVEQIARDKGCCKITLEVLDGNEIAKSSYRKFGFNGYELDPEVGSALFWQKEL